MLAANVLLERQNSLTLFFPTHGEMNGTAYFESRRSKESCLIFCKNDDKRSVKANNLCWMK